MPKTKKPFLERASTGVSMVVLVITICSAFAVYSYKGEVTAKKVEDHEIRIDDLEEKDLRKEFQLQTIEDMAKKTEDFTQGMESVLKDFAKSYAAMKEYNETVKKELQEYRTKNLQNDTTLDFNVIR